ncbi:hypothetical protein [Microbacterium sp.]|uniref:hypothetical protein n=1 Tax=Microbacterium sp. TaxID=51671 RepID=UPI00260711D2|nr:hypothetical protein [Microbacterium sp.]
MRAEYGIDLREVLETRSMPLQDLVDLVAWIPAGSAVWQSFGGPAAVSEAVAMLRAVDFSVRVLDYHAGRHGKGKKPEPPKPPAYAHERRAREERALRKAQSRLRMRGRIPRGRNT